MIRLAVLLAGLVTVTGCGLTTETAAPHCGEPERVAVVAQSVPTAAYLPCLQALPEGWRVTAFHAERGASRLSLLSDRSGGHPVELTLAPRCDVRGASPATPRAQGVRSYLRLSSISPDYTGTLYDVFAGGCLSSRFRLPRGPHIPLLEQLASTVDLVSRRDLRLELRHRLGVELDP